MDGTRVSAIPDADIYLHDDWGDNKLQDREDSGTTTHNGVEGVYRPEWTIRDNEPTVSDEKLTITGGDGITANINVNLDETVTAEINDFDLSGQGDSSSDYSVYHIWAEQTTDASSAFLDESYAVQMKGGGAGSDLRLVEVDGSGNINTLIDSGQQPTTGNIEVTRQPDGTWELFIDDESQGTATDTSHTNPQVTAFLGRDGANDDFAEIKTR